MGTKSPCALSIFLYRDANCQLSIDLMTFAGTPPTMVFAGTSFVTTAPAATMALSPMVTPERIVAFEPTHTLRPSRMGFG